MINDFFEAHQAEANSVKGRAYRAVNTVLNGLAQKFTQAHGFVAQFRAQAMTGNRVQRHSVVGQALEHDAAIQAFSTKGINGKTAALAYA